MSSSIPEGWTEIKLGQIVKLQGGNAFQSSDFKEKGIPIVRISNIQNNLVDLSSAVYCEETKHFENFLISNGDILLAMSGATTGKIGRYRYPFKSYLNQRVGKFQIIKNNLIDYDFLNHLVNSNTFTKNTMIDAIGGAQPNISSAQVEGVFYVIPPLPEQKKIATILTSVDEVIENTQKKIDKLQDLKKSVMIDLMNKGINHKEFKDTKLGKIPKTWNIYKYNDLLKIVDNKLEMKDDKFYSLLSIKRRNGGVFSREKLIGKKILTKTLGKAIVDTFIISKMQIVHGASGYISEKFKDHCVSSSYIQFAAKDRNKINTKFIFYYSHLDKVYKQFLLSSHGVHIEKMTFDLKDWFKREIILPNIEEQQEIVRIIESFENHISNTEKELEKYNFFKKSLLQDLLTGKVRVSDN